MGTTHPQARAKRIGIIGTGFGGIGMAIALKKAGYQNVVLFEKADSLGGCWRDNTYPGAACDVPSHLYSYSFAPKHDWSRKFAPQAEILAYLQECADRFDVTRHIRFGAEVAQARYEEARKGWSVHLADGHCEDVDVLITACGQLNRPLLPKVDGLSRFEGPQFHSAQWRHDIDLKGKTVAVIGTGASAIQFVPEVAKIAAQVNVFQRSAPWVSSKGDRSYNALELALFKHLPLYRAATRTALYWKHESFALGFTRFSWLLKPFGMEAMWTMRRTVKDENKRKACTPNYQIGCKRVLLSNDWYAAMARPNVALIDQGLASVDEHGVNTRDGTHHRADVLIYGTGFAATDFLTPMQITGRNGLDLNHAWQDGAQAYLGIALNGFPNLFMLYGPNTNLAHSSIIFMLESQIRYVMSALHAMERAGAQAMDVKPQVMNAFNDRLQQRMRGTVWEAGCSSWYRTASGRNTANWPGFTFEYRLKTRAIATQDYEWDGQGLVPSR